jgi:o-succinylbenzoate synthase
VRLTSVEVIPYALPFKQPYVTARGALTQREMVLLRLTTDDGIVGLGEAVPLSLRGGATLEQVVRELRETDESEALHDLIERGDIDYASPRAILDPRLQLSRPSQCAVLNALDDICAKWDGEAGPSSSIACNATLTADDPAAVAAAALEWAEDGFSTFKLKLGAGEDVAQVRAVREALGPGARIRVDANASWSLPAAARILADLEPFEIELVEQPVASMEESAQLAEMTSIPLAGDESIASPEDAERAAEIGAFQLTGIKESKVGGYYAGMEIGEKLPAYVSSALDGPVGIASAWRLAASLDTDRDYHQGAPVLAHGLGTQRLFASTIAAVECELRDGMLYLPPGPGLGVVIDEDALQAHRL